MSIEKHRPILEWMLSPEIYFSPYQFALGAYSWGKGDLRDHPGPRKWQREIMLDIERYLREGLSLQQALGFLPDYYKHSIASGRGPGKSALVGMLAHWFISTRIGGSVWVAANGKPQLQDKTFPEIAKWVARGINSPFFELNATSIRPSRWFADYIESPQGMNKSTLYYYIVGQLWSKEAPDAFAGAHNFDGEMSIFDEASGIPDEIYPVQEGVFTEDIIDRFWLCFSNPRKGSGAFFETFHKNRDRWRNTQIDSRTVEGINHSTFQSIIEQYGEDSDEARIEVYGQFPNVGDNQFIGMKMVDEALAREKYNDQTAATVIGVDIARFGSDKTCIVVRSGRDLVSVQKFSGLDTMQTVGRVIEAIDRWKPDLVAIDEGGLGAGVVDRLLEQRYKVRGVNFGWKANSVSYANNRAEMWGSMRTWMKTASLGGSSKREDQYLKDELMGPEYTLTSTGAIQLESKDSMRKRGVASPDVADALALTFAYPVANKESQNLIRDTIPRSRTVGRTFSQHHDASWMA